MEDVRLKFFTPQQIQFIDAMVVILEKEGLSKEAARLSSCGGKYNIFRCLSIADNGHPQHDIAFPYYCELRICERCCRKRAAALEPEIIALLKSFKETQTHKYSLLTLTKNMSTISQLTPDIVRAFNKNVRKLINKLYPKSLDCGALSVIEFGKGLNMHAHVIVYGPYYPQPEISQRWREITGDSFIVHITAIEDCERVAGYLLKYIAKPPSFHKLDDYCTYLKAIKGVRRLHRYGIFYGYKVSEDEVTVCPYCGGGLRYVSTAIPSNLGGAREYADVMKGLSAAKNGE